MNGSMRGESGNLSQIVEHVAWYVPVDESKATGADAVRAVAHHYSAPVLGWWLRNEAMIRDAIGDGLPVAVMAAAGISSDEVRWTKYLHHMFDPGAEHRLGPVLASALFEAVTGMPPVEPLAVMQQVPIGSSLCTSKGCDAECAARVDLVISDQNTIVAIEQKTVSGQSDWRCRSCDAGVRGQLDRYAELLGRWDGRQDRQVHRVYLTPSGDDQKTEAGTWRGLSYRALSEILVRAVMSSEPPLRGARQHSALALILDLNAGFLGDWNHRVRGLRRQMKALSGGPPRPDQLYSLWHTMNLPSMPALCTALGLTYEGENMSDAAPQEARAYLRHHLEIKKAERAAKDYLSAVWKGPEGVAVMIGELESRTPSWAHSHQWANGCQRGIAFEHLSIPAPADHVLYVWASDGYNSELTLPTSVIVKGTVNSQPAKRAFRDALGADRLTARLADFPPEWERFPGQRADLVTLDLELRFDSAAKDARRIAEKMVFCADELQRVVATSLASESQRS